MERVANHALVSTSSFLGGRKVLFHMCKKHFLEILQCASVQSGFF